MPSGYLSFSNISSLLQRIPFIGTKLSPNRDGYTEKISTLFGRLSGEPAFKCEAEHLALFKQALWTSQAKFKGLSTDKLKEILGLLLDDVEMKKPIQAILQLFNENELLEIARFKQKAEAINVIRIQSGLKEKALQSILQTKGRAIWKEIVPEMIYFFHHLMDLFITITGFNQIGENTKNPFI